MSNETQLCDQFIYTTAEINQKKGYQVIAKSAGIDDNIINKLSNYLYPIGITPNLHKTSKSLVVVDNEYVAYSVVKNIGNGYDGRSGTLYTHTIVIGIDKFKKLDFNSKVFDKYLIDDYHIRGILEQLKIKPIDPNIDFPYLKKYDGDFLIIILSAMMNNHKFAIINNIDIDLIQNLLLLLPINMRLVPFSTQVAKPDKQPNYKIIQSSFHIQTKLNDDFIIIDKNLSKYDERYMSPNAKKFIDILYSADKHKMQIAQDDLLRDIKKEQKIHTQDKIYTQDKIQINSDLLDIDKLSDILANGELLSLHKKIVQLYDKQIFNEYAITISGKIREELDDLLIVHNKQYLGKENLLIILSISKIILDYLTDMKNKKTKKTNKKISQLIRKEITNYQLFTNSYLNEIKNYY